MRNLEKLLEEYYKAPEIFQAGKYWKAHEDRIINEIRRADITQLRSGKYPIFGAFGFSELIYYYHPNTPIYIKRLKQIIRRIFITDKALLPYSLRLGDIREMAYNFCMAQGETAKIKSISEIEVSTFGNPSDLFEMDGKKYTMQFLNYYIRLCFAQKYLKLKGDETIVELGSGSGFQVEILKKVFPDLTILCFDLPYPLFLCEKYLSESLGEKSIIKSTETIDYTNLSAMEKKKVHMFGNWKFPILNNEKFDVFWNAASFGEMEPAIVRNYLVSLLNHVTKRLSIN